MGDHHLDHRLYFNFHLGDDDVKKDRVDRMRLTDDLVVKEGENYEAVLYDFYHKELTLMLEKLNALDPQL